MLLAVLIVASFVAFALLWVVGANDVANALGTSVGSGALQIRTAILLGAIFEFLGSSLMGGQVAQTLGSSIADHSDFQSERVFALGMFATLCSSFIWIAIGTILALPLSSTHTVLGGVVGFALVGTDFENIQWGELGKIAVSWFVSPVLGGSIAFTFYSLVRRFLLAPPNKVALTRRYVPWLLSFVVATDVVFVLIGGPPTLQLDLNAYQMGALFVAVILLSYFPSRVVIWRWSTSTGHSKDTTRPVSADDSPVDVESQPSRVNPSDTDKTNLVQSDDFGNTEACFIPLMAVTACTVAFAHGGNDVANAIGPFYVIVDVYKDGEYGNDGGIPLYISVLGGVGIVVGLATFGSRVMETVGTKITPLTFSKGFCAQFGAGVSVLLATVLGIPISTTSVIVGSVMGVGLATGKKAVDFNVFLKILAGWVVTLPSAAFLTMALFTLFRSVDSD